MTPHKHLRDIAGCPVCNKIKESERKSKATRLTTEEWVEQAQFMLDL